MLYVLLFCTKQKMFGCFKTFQTYTKFMCQIAVPARVFGQTFLPLHCDIY